MVKTVEARGLGLSYGQHLAFDHLDLEVEKGKCIGISGASGSGKSSMIKVLCGLIPPSKGDLFIDGLNTKKIPLVVKSKVGYMPEDDGLDGDLSCFDTVAAHGALYNIKRSEIQLRTHDLLRRVFLDEYESAPVYSLSRGQKRRLSLARSLINRPEILMIDSPIKDLGQTDRSLIWKLLRDQIDQGHTVIIASRDLDQIEQLCHHVLILDKGKITCQGEPENLVQQYIGCQVIEYDIKLHDLDYYLHALNGLYPYQLIGEKLRVYLREGVDMNNVIRWMPSEKILYRKAELKDVYIKLMGHEISGSISL